MASDHDSGKSANERAVGSPMVKAFSLGPFETNCYVIANAGVTDGGGSSGGTCWVADVGMEPDELIKYLRDQKLRPEAVVLTHAHFDHTGGLFEFITAFPGTPIFIHADEKDWINDPILNLSGLIGMPVTGPEANHLLRHHETLTLSDEQWRVLHTPGHSPGGVTLVHDRSKQAIVGDTLFAEGVGRSDFPGSDPRMLEASIRQQLYTLPDETVVYPGHGPATSIGREKRFNPYVRP